jgi:hypothetical protein
VLLSTLSTEYLALRAASGLMLLDSEVLDCAVRAARQYAAYGDITSALDGDAVEIAPDTDVTLGEWALIRPLFELFAERENAMRISTASAGGIESFGRSVAEVEGDINAYLASLPELSYDAEIITVE